MIRQLSSDETEALLKQQTVGHMGCYDGRFPYVVPISYVYDGKYIYCYSQEGKKITILRKNPRICLQVDELKDMSNWRSAIVLGRFEELNDREERNKALTALLKKQLPAVSAIRAHLGQTWPFVNAGSNGLDNIEGIVFRIEVGEKTGKCECTSESPALSFN